MKLLIVLLSLCLAVQSSRTKQMSDREHAGFVGPVKSVFMEYEMTERNYGDRLAGRHCRGLTEIYNESGRLIQRSVYPGNCGEDEIREIYTYASDGSRTSSSDEVRDKNSPPPPPPAAGIKGDSSDDTGPAREVFRYDKSGKLVESSLVKPKGKLIDRTVYEYDPVGRLIETRSYEPEGPISYRRVEEYEGNNKVPSTFRYIDGRGQVREKTTYSDYEFNPQGDWIKRKVRTEGAYNHKQSLIETRKLEYYSGKK